jgi:16S rRNA (cytidine1402-2'-O)-methyltransferase
VSIDRGVLYVVATPIGNLQDLSPRAALVLSEVDLILAEDTRKTSRLLQHIGTATPMRSHHEHNERELCAGLIEDIGAGATLAIVSDAGTPLICDPGFHLVQAAHDAGIRVVPIAGPSALTAVLSAAGFNAQRFTFNGYLPPRSAARVRALQAQVKDESTNVFLEAPHRIVASLADMRQVFGPQRRVCVARELSKRYETIRVAPLVDLENWVLEDENRQRGEFIVAVAPAPASEKAEQPPDELIAILVKYLSASNAAAAAAEITGQRKNALYRLALGAKDRPE